jgi:hypothetical protein
MIMANVAKVIQRCYGVEAVSITMTAFEPGVLKGFALSELAKQHGFIVTNLYCVGPDTSEWDLTQLYASGIENGRRTLFIGNLNGSRLSLPVISQLGKVGLVPLQFEPGEELLFGCYAFPGGKKPVTARIYCEYSYAVPGEES